MARSARDDPEAFRNEFLRVVLEDRSAGRVRELSGYLRLFPDQEREVEHLHRELFGGEVAPLDPIEPVPESPVQVGPYRIVRRIGSGGQGVVYLAQDTRLPRRVALKVVKMKALPFSDEGLARIRREAEILSRLADPRIASIYEAGEWEGHYYVAMRFVQGSTLAELLVRDGRRAEGMLPLARAHRAGGAAEQEASDPDLEVGAVALPRSGSDREGLRRLLRLFEQVARALHVAHENGVVHRDLKPHNIMVTPDREPVVLDFGLARVTDDSAESLTLTGDVFGTPAYMAPEQVRGEQQSIGVRTDVYSLAATLYQCLTGRLPFDLAGREALFQAILSEDPPDPRRFHPGLPADVVVILGKALEKEPQRRFSSAEALADDLDRFLTHQPIHARTPSLGYRVRKYALRHRELFFGLVATVLVLIGGSVSTTIYALRASRSAELSRQERKAAESRAYRADIGAAAAGLDSNRPSFARRVLAEALPELRNWEWAHLRNRADPVVSIHKSDFDYGRSRRVAFDAQDVPLFVRIAGTVALVCDARSGTTVRELHATSRLDSVCISVGARWACAVTESRDELWLWELTTGVARSIAIDESPVARVQCVSPLGSTVVLDLGSSVVFMETATGTVRSPFDLPLSSGLAAVFSLTDDQLVCVRAGGGSTALGAVNTGSWTSRLVMLEGESVAVAVSSEGTVCLNGTDGQSRRSVELRDPNTLQLRSSLHGHAGGVEALACSAEGRLVAACLSTFEFRVWDAESGATLGAWSGESIADTVRLGADGSHLLTSASRRVELVEWDYAGYLELSDHESYLMSVAFSPDSSLVATSSWDKTARLWDALDGECLAVFEVGSTGPIGFTSDGEVLVVGSAAWDTATGEPLDIPLAPDFVANVRPGSKGKVSWNGENSARSHDGLLIASPGPGTTVVKDAGSGEVVRVLPGLASTAVAFHPDGTRILCGRQDGTIVVCDLESGEELHEFTAHLNEVFSLVFSPDGSRLVSAGNDGAVLVWDAATFELVLELRGHASYVHSVDFSPDGTRIASASGDSTVRIWDSVSRRERSNAIARRRRVRAEMRPHVLELLQALGDPAAVAARIRADTELSTESRRAALYVLLVRE